MIFYGRARYIITNDELTKLNIDAWNAAIEAAAALLEMDDEILPYTIEQIRKLKKLVWSNLSLMM